MPEALVLTVALTNLTLLGGHYSRGKKKSRFFDCTEDSFLAQVIEKPTRKSALLDLTLTNKKRKNWAVT